MYKEGNYMAYKTEVVLRASERPTGFEQGYYNLTPLANTKCAWLMAIGQRSNGKTYAVIDRIIKKFIDSNEKYFGVYVRRRKEDLRYVERLVNPHDSDIDILTNGKYNGSHYYQRKFYLVKKDKDGKIVNKSKPLLFTYCLSTWESEKGQDLSEEGKYECATVVYDEFLSRDREISDEHVVFLNVLSSIIRTRDNVEIWCLANTVSKTSSLCDMIGVNLDKLEQGNIYRLTHNNTTTIAIEYCAQSNVTSAVNDKYFNFDTKQADVIRSGGWELSEHLLLSHNMTKSSTFITRLYVVTKIAYLDLSFYLSKNKVLFCGITRASRETVDNCRDYCVIIEDVMEFYLKPNVSHDLINNKIYNKLFIDCYNKGALYFQSDTVADYLRSFLNAYGINNRL